MTAPAKGATTVASLPNDVVFEILSRTPVKSVCRFRCVSRGWRALVSDEVFVAAHESCTEPHLLLVANSSNKERGSQGRDLRLLGMHRNVVKVIRKVGFHSAFCPSFDDAICVTFGDGGNTNLVDLATGKVILTQTWSGLHDGSSCGFGFGCAMQSYSFGFGRAIPSSLYKAVPFHNPRLERTLSTDLRGTHTGGGLHRVEANRITCAYPCPWKLCHHCQWCLAFYNDPMQTNRCGLFVSMGIGGNQNLAQWPVQTE
jgi:hypothetical protein